VRWIGGELGTELGTLALAAADLKSFVSLGFAHAFGISAGAETPVELVPLSESDKIDQLYPVERLTYYCHFQFQILQVRCTHPGQELPSLAYELQTTSKTHRPL